MTLYIESNQHHSVQELVRELETLPNTPENNGRRCNIGDTLGVIGDTRRGVGLTDGIPDILFLPVSPGGDIEIENYIFKVQPFYIARYLVTHMQYEAFIAATDGFHNPKWWEGFPNEYQPQSLSNQLINSLNNPRDSVSWYQAVAFCRWLNKQYQTLRLFPRALVFNTEQNGITRQSYDNWKTIETDGWVIRLPTEWEWQWAAQAGIEARQYPWGKWQDGYAATSESGLGRAVAVGMYPHGMAHCGALDMAGNLCEWCLNDFEKAAQISMGNGERKVMRGGSFSYLQYSARTPVRDNHKPEFRFKLNGFRVVLGHPVNSV